MEIAIILMAALAFYHFIYEAILAPSFRLHLRFELFKLRDELRQLKLQRQENLEQEHFDHLQNSINTLIAVLYKFDFATIALADAESRHNPEFKRRVEERSRSLDNCHIWEAQEIRRKSLVVAAKALAVNSGGWALYMVPAAIVVIGYSQLKKRVRLYASLSANDFAKFSVEDDFASSSAT